MFKTGRIRFPPRYHHFGKGIVAYVQWTHTRWAMVDVGLRCLLAAAKVDGASDTPDAVALSLNNICNIITFGTSCVIMIKV